MIGTIKLEPNLSEEMLIAIYQSYKEDEMIRKENLKKKYPELFLLAKEFVEFDKANIYNQLKKHSEEGVY